MPCCGQCAGIEREFNTKVAARELAAYRRRGIRGTTKMLIGLLRQAQAEGATLLDIGGGIGAIQHELAAGLAQITSVDAAPAYLEAQKSEAARQGYAGRVSYRHGDFVTVAGEIPEHDVVTLDRVICCYPDMRALVERSAERARRFYAAVYPRGTWWNVVGLALGNIVMRLRRSSFRGYVHSPAQIERILAAHGLRLQAARETFIWRVAVYGR